MFHSGFGYLTEKSCARHVFRDGEMKKFFGLSLAVVILGGLLYSCGKSETISISIPESLELKVGEMKSLTTIVQDDNVISINGGVTVSWASSNPEIATVNEDGLIRAISPGECEISATYKEKSAICKLTVIEGELPVIIQGTSISTFIFTFNCSGGSFVDLPSSAEAGETVCFSVSVEEDSKLESIDVIKTDGSNEIVPFTEENDVDLHYCFVMPDCGVSVHASFGKK